MRVKVDTSDFTIRKVLSMKCEDKKQKLIVYISKLLKKAEINYKIYNEDMLTIIKYLKAWKYFLEEAKSQFKIWIDYKNLEYFIIAQKLNQRQAR